MTHFCNSIPCPICTDRSQFEALEAQEVDRLTRLYDARYIAARQHRPGSVPERTWRDSVPFAMLVLFVTLLVIPAVVVLLGWFIGGYVGIIVAVVVLLIPLTVLNT